MGPECSLPYTSSLQFLDKIPPSFDGYGDYQQYSENVVLWDAMTSVTPQRRAPTIIGQLTGQAQVTAKTLPLAQLTSEDGVSGLLKEMDKKFGLDPVTLLHNNVADFFDYNWDRQMSVEEFVVGFHSRLDKISKLDMNEDLKSHLLLKQANLDSHDRNLVVGAAGGDYSLQALATSLRNAFRSEGFPTSSLHSNGAAHTLSSPSGSRTRTDEVVSVTSHPPSTRDSSTCNPLFYTFHSVENSGEAPSAIIDSGACASVVGRSTLDQAMSQLGIEKLKEEGICQRIHQFGPSDKPLKTICAVRVLFACKATGTDRAVNFDVRFDVIEGKLPFLIGLPSLLAMKASLNFQYSSLSFAVHNVLYRMQLVRVASHLRLPLISKITYQRPLGPTNGTTNVIRSRVEQPNKPASKHHLTVASTNPVHFNANKKDLSMAQLMKVHRQLGHASATQMKKFIRESRSWRHTYGKYIDSVVANCACALAAPPASRPVCSASKPPKENQSHLSLDVVYFNGRPFLHVIDDRTKWSEIGLLRTRRLRDQIEIFKRIQLHRHGLPTLVRADQEFNKNEFLDFCSSLGIKFAPVDANHHEGNAIVERANRTIRQHAARLALAEPRMSLVDRIIAATFHKNTSRGHNKASSFELLYKRTPRLSTVCNPSRRGSAMDNLAGKRRRQLRICLKSKTRANPSFATGDIVYFWRDGQGWVGPGQVENVTGRTVQIMHQGTLKSADVHRVRSAPAPDPNKRVESEDEDDATNCNRRQETGKPHVVKSTINKNRNVISCRARRSEAERLLEENRGIIEGLPVTRNRPSRNETHLTYATKNCTTTVQSDKLSIDERKSAYQREKMCWIDNKAYTQVPRWGIPPGSNIIGSHVVYKRKDDGTPKARIVPWGHRDVEKETVRGDAPSLNLDSMRLLLSFAAQHKWRVRKMDVKSAFLQAKGFKRDIYVRPPREDNNDDVLWKLLVPAYGLTESGRLWYLTSYEALTKQFGFKKSRLDPSMYIQRKGNNILLLVVQIDDYLYAGSERLASKFENFLHSQFQIGSTESTSFSIMGSRLNQDPSGRITLDAKEKLRCITPLHVDQTGCKTKDRRATDAEVTAYRSVIGKLLYIGRLVSPAIAFHASHAATKCFNLYLHHLRALNATLRALQKFSCVITFLPSAGRSFKLEAMADASMRSVDDKTNVREGIIIFRRSQNVVHPISWSSRLGKRVARSTSTAELLAAADAVDKLTFFKHLLEEFTEKQTTELILDSCSALCLCSSFKEPEEVRNKLILATIREEFHTKSMSSVRWTPGQSHLADALTKDNANIAGLLDKVLTGGTHSHPESSYAVPSDVPPPPALN